MRVDYVVIGGLENFVYDDAYAIFYVFVGELAAKYKTGSCKTSDRLGPAEDELKDEAIFLSN